MGKLTLLLKVSGLTVGYNKGSKKEKKIAGPINTEMYAGQLICLLGPNGAGKSTLLRTLAGLQPALNGVIELTGDPLHKLSTAQISKKLSLVLTDSVKSANLDVYSLVSLGRYPYSGWLGNLSTQDKETVEWALKATQVDHFRDRKITHLSDGECQKVMLARALAQDTPLIILDEPTAHLDLPSRIELMRLLHKLTKETNKGILLSTHELDLALQVADKIWLINKNGLLENESPEAMVLNGTFEAAFDKSGVVFDKSTGTFNIHQNQGRSVQIIGEGAAAFWTKRALIRQGYLIDASSTIIIEVRLVKNLTEWKITYNQNSVIKTTIDDATNHLTTLV